MNIVVPRPTSGGMSAGTNYNLYTWASKFTDMYKKWRRDPNSLFTMPFPADIVTVRGDANVLSVDRKIDYIRQNIAMAMDLPISLLTGDMSYSGSSVTLRILENLFQERINDFTIMDQEFIIPNMKQKFDLPDIDITGQDFKMADDAQQKSIALQLRGSNILSDETTLDELGFDSTKEKERGKKEAEMRLGELRKQQVDQARVQAETMQILADAETQAGMRRGIGQIKLQKLAEKLQTDVGLEKLIDRDIKGILRESFAPIDSNIVESYNSYKDDAQTRMFLKGVPDSLKSQYLKDIADVDPKKAQQLQQRARELKAESAQIKPLPQQKPPRRAGEAANVT